MIAEDKTLMALLAGRLGAQFAYVVDTVRERYGFNVHLRRPGGPEAVAMYVVHHTAGSQVVGLHRSLRQSWDYHIRRKGWATGGYALLVDASGHVFMVARPYEHMTYGAGARWNPTTIHLCVMGNYETHAPPTPVLRSLYLTLCSLDDVAYKPWRGHREIRSTACPGKYLLPHIQRMRGGDYGAAHPRPTVYP